MYASMNETFVALQHIDVLPKRDSKFLLWYRVYGVFSPEQLKNVTVETASYGEVGTRQTFRKTHKRPVGPQVHSRWR